MKRFKMQRRGDNAEILIYDTIGEDFWGGVSSKAFYEDLKALGTVDELKIRINSEGGNLFEGFAMYNQILAADAGKRLVVIDALAASAASLVAMAGDEIQIAKNAWVMIHNPMGFAMGDYRVFDEQSVLLRQLSDKVADTYAERSNFDRDTIQTMMDEETWMDSDTAVKNGFADKEIEQLAVAANLNMCRFRHPPKAIWNNVDTGYTAAKLASMSRRVDKLIDKLTNRD